MSQVAARLTGSAPSEIVVLGVQPEIIGWSTQLTATVEAALAALIERAIAQVSRWAQEIEQAQIDVLIPAGERELAPAAAD